MRLPAHRRGLDSEELLPRGVDHDRRVPGSRRVPAVCARRSSAADLGRRVLGRAADERAQPARPACPLQAASAAQPDE